MAKKERLNLKMSLMMIVCQPNEEKPKNNLLNPVARTVFFYFISLIKVWVKVGKYFYYCYID